MTRHAGRLGGGRAGRSPSPGEPTMPGYKDVLHALETCDTAADVQRACGLPPSRLQRIMRSPRFRRELELEREFVEFRGRREAHKAACLAADTLANALNGHCEREVRLAAGAVVRLALREARREIQTPMYIGVGTVAPTNIEGGAEAAPSRPKPARKALKTVRKV